MTTTTEQKELYIKRALPNETNDIIRQTITNFLSDNYHGIIEEKDDIDNSTWIAGLSITRFDAEKHLPVDLEYDEEERKDYIEKEGLPHFIARFIIMSSDTIGDYNPAVMGHEVYFQYKRIDIDSIFYVPIWENLWIESQPALCDGNFFEGISWINELNHLGYLCIDNPFEVEKPRVYVNDIEEEMQKYHYEIMIEEGLISEEQIEIAKNFVEKEESVNSFRKKIFKPKTYTTVEFKENK